MLIGSKCGVTLSQRKYKSSFEDVFSVARRRFGMENTP